MRHNQNNNNFKFVKDPVDFNKFTSKDLLKYCLGATLYMPGTLRIVDKILNKNGLDVTSIVMDFEDAVDESDVSRAEDSVLDQLNILYKTIQSGELTYDELPLIFLRVRNLDQFDSFSKKLGHNHADVLSGFTFPKFSSKNCKEYFNQLYDINQKLNVKLYALPILEGKTIAYKELRTNELIKIKECMEPYKESILNLRVGGTDMSAIFGVRRGMSYSIYDIHPVRDCLSDILNIFTREKLDYAISGPVWEYFLANKEENLDNFLDGDIHHSLLTRTPILNDAVDGLMREVIIDKANGFIGKTIIHPSHAKYVNAMQAVVKEEYEDALQIIETPGGVKKSVKSNKMNEINPHRYWAKKVIKRATAYGVIENETSYFSLFKGE